MIIEYIMPFIDGIADIFTQGGIITYIILFIGVYGLIISLRTIIVTGIPAGVGMGMTPPTFLIKGDVVKCEIEKIGTLENVIA